MGMGGNGGGAGVLSLDPLAVKRSGRRGHSLGLFSGLWADQGGLSAQDKRAMPDVTDSVFAHIGTPEFGRDKVDEEPPVAAVAAAAAAASAGASEPPFWRPGMTHGRRAYFDGSDVSDDGRSKDAENGDLHRPFRCARQIRDSRDVDMERLACKFGPVDLGVATNQSSIDAPAAPEGSNSHPTVPRRWWEPTRDGSGVNGGVRTSVPCHSWLISAYILHLSPFL
ncbi:unnamed protein product [Vitrella brassicaformis CCMP3155]|uniref:Uncharacterized protein n=1 Tax=Vitrella brassicaformis (strain CCMP3155) TaxID=1169540 RepID=A0A0G4FKR4_VITBC|nr:unnamed protein product [Vitrella brassicaformis CCMP3155]|eukprot:CEM14203.1 unnamed protein product [Vitrella brassicaformis CCMP3155]